MKIFSTHSAEKIRRGTLLCLTKFLVPKTFIDKRGGREGASQFSIKSFCPTVPENFVEEPFCVRYFLASKNFKDKKGGGYNDFSSKVFCLTVPNHSVVKTFCVSDSFVYRKILWIREGAGITIFC